MTRQNDKKCAYPSLKMSYICHEIGLIADSNPAYTKALHQRIARECGDIESMTIGQLLRISRDEAECYNKTHGVRDE